MSGETTAGDTALPDLSSLRRWLDSPLPPLRPPDPDLPRISIVVPSFNQARWLDDCLRSIRLQDYPGVEVIVMDGGSSDGSVGIIHRHAGALAHWQSGPDGGQAAGINAGLDRATGDLLGWLNSDDLLLPGALHTLARAAAAVQTAAWFQGDALELVDVAGELRPYPWSHDLSPERLAWAQTGCQPSLYWHRSLALRLDPTLHYALDWDLQNRLARTAPLVRVGGRLSVNRIHGDSKTRTGNVRMADEYYRITRRYGGSMSRSLLYRYGLWAAARHRARHGETWINRLWHRAAAGMLRRLHGEDSIYSFNWYHFA